MVFNSSFYYFCRDFGGLVVRYDFELQREVASVRLPNVATSGDHYLYTTQHNYVDLNADDNGIWAIYTTNQSTHTNVVKLDPKTLVIQYGWNISINHNKVGEMFIVCGVLYAIDSATERNTRIRLAVDLYRGTFLDDVNLAFTNPFKNTTMASYNHRLKELYTWDRGNQLTYPIRYNNMTNGANGSSNGGASGERVDYSSTYESDSP